MFYSGRECSKETCFALFIHSNTCSLSGERSLTDHDVYLLSRLKNNLAVNQFLICVFEKLGLCFKILQLFTGEDVFSGAQGPSHFPQRQKVPNIDHGGPSFFLKIEAMILHPVARCNTMSALCAMCYSFQVGQGTGD